MNQYTEVLLSAALVGTLATGAMDLGGWILSAVAGVPMPRYDLVGRWIGWMRRGRFVHVSIAASPAIRGEKLLGWVTHYAIGVVFACGLVVTWGVEWVERPSLAPALIVGIGSVAAPFFLMQPCMGAGLASRRTPNPRTARLRSLVNHALFAVGLYLAGWLARWLLAPS